MSAGFGGGLGITFRVDAVGQFYVVRVHPFGPSAQKGIAPEDRLISIDGIPVSGRSFDDLASYISSTTVGWVTLKLERQSNEFGDYVFEAIIPDLRNAMEPEKQRGWERPTTQSPVGSAVPLLHSLRGQQSSPSAWSVPHDLLEVTVPRSQQSGGVWGEWRGVGIDINFDDVTGFCSISAIHPNGGADQSGLLWVGDVIQKVNGDHMRGMRADEVSLAIRGSPSAEVLFTIMRPRQPRAYAAAWRPTVSHTPPRTSQEHLSVTQQHHEHLKCVTLERSRMPDHDAGTCDVGIGFRRAEDGAFIVQAIVAHGPADRDGRVHVGDILLELNDTSVRHVSPLQLQQMLAGPAGTKVKLLLTPSNEFPPPPEKVVPSAEQVRGAEAAASELALGGLLLSTLSTVDGEQLAHDIRSNAVKSMGKDSLLDGVAVWLTHMLLCTALFLGLAHENMIEADVDLSTDHFGSRQPEATSGPYFYILAPLALVSLVALLLGVVFVYLHFHAGRIASIYVFSRRSGLFSISLYGNPFLGVTILLGYWHLSQHGCCRWISDTSEPLLIILLPLVIGVLLYILWAIVLEMLIANPIEARLRSELLPVRFVLRDSLLGAILITGVVFLFLKWDDRLDTRWMLATSPLQAALVLVFFLSYKDLIELSCIPARQRPRSTRLALMGVVDSATLEMACVFVCAALDDPSWAAHRVVLVVVLAVCAAIYTALLIFDCYFACCSPRPRPHQPSPREWLEPVPLAVLSSSSSQRVALRVTWPAPVRFDRQPPFDSFRLEMCVAPSSLAVSSRPTVLRGDQIPKELLWTEFYSTEQQVAVVGNLVPATSYILRVTGRWDAVQNRAAMGPLVVMRLPDHAALGMPGTHRRAPTPPAQPSQRPQETKPVYATAAPTPPRIASAANLGASKRPAQHGFGRAFPGPLMLKGLHLSGGMPGSLYAVLEWEQQAHFSSNILDLRLVSSTDSSVEPHDFTTVYAGPDASVRVYNIEPSSSYVARLRAGDFHGDELGTVVERCELPFQTPSVEELLGGAGTSHAARAAPQLSPIRASYRSDLDPPLPLPASPPWRPHWLDRDLNSSRSPLLARHEAAEVEDGPPYGVGPMHAVAASPGLLPNGMSQWVPHYADPRRTPSPPPLPLPHPSFFPPPPPPVDPRYGPVGAFPLSAGAPAAAHPVWL